MKSCNNVYKKMLFDNILTIVENKERHQCVLEIHLNLVVHSLDLTEEQKTVFQ